MTNPQCNAEPTLSTNLDEQLETLKTQQEELAHIYHFFLNAFEALTNTDNNPVPVEDWHTGMWLTGLWVGQQHYHQLELAVSLQQAWEDMGKPRH